ncbi:DUF5131 family protein [Azospirillum sp. sgz302134]
MTGIEWTDFSGNHWAGCTRIAAVTGARSGCEICYAAGYGEQRLGMNWGPGAPRRRFASFTTRMRRLNDLAARTGLPFSVFPNSLGDWLDPEVDPSWRTELLTVFEECSHLTWLPLTHRPHLATKLLPASWRTTPPPNVWAGVTVDHALHGFRWGRHAEFWGHTGRAWVSAEPLASSLATTNLDGAACIIVGGASGTADPSWELSDAWVDELVARHGPQRIFYKQKGDIVAGVRVGKKAAGRAVYGRIYDHTPWPRHRQLLVSVAKGPLPAPAPNAAE